MSHFNTAWLGAAVVLGLFQLAGQAAPPEVQLDRAVLVMRHGVRPPTKSASELAPLARDEWPSDAQWGAAPGELTPHGAAAIEIFGADLRNAYARDNLIPARGSLGEAVLIWADGADQRTRETARSLARGLNPASPIDSGSSAAGASDPLFDGLASGSCKLDPVLVEGALPAVGTLMTPRVADALQRLQNIVAPDACNSGRGACLSGKSEVAASAKGLKLTGPLATGAMLAEDLLLEYEDGLSGQQFAWGRATRADLDLVMAAHERSAELTRRAPYVAVHRAATLARLILSVLQNAPAPVANPRVSDANRLVILVGHDTNLSNISAVFHLDYRLAGQPDSTAPATAISFERWRNTSNGETTLRVRVLYQDPDQVRDLSHSPAHELSVLPGICQASDPSCELNGFARTIANELPPDCR